MRYQTVDESLAVNPTIRFQTLDVLAGCEKRLGKNPNPYKAAMCVLNQSFAFSPALSSFHSRMG
jgi:hypothetical protein